MEKEEIINLTVEEKKYLPLIINTFENNLDVLIKKIQSELLSMIFQNDFTLYPYEFKKIIKDEIIFFLKYLKTKDINLSIFHAEQARIKGLDINIILSLFDKYCLFIIEHFLNNNNQAIISSFNIIKKYKKLYIQAYIQEHNNQIFNQQEQVSKSLLATVTKQQQEIAEKERQLQNAKIKALEEKEQAKTAFLINLSHEIKLPLTILRNSVNEAKEQAGNRRLPALGKVDTGIEQLTNMVINMLDYEKIKQGKMIYAHEDVVNISSIVQAKAEVFHRICVENNITLTSDINENLYTRIDSYALDRILNNILDNAVKYNNEPGIIHISITDHDNIILLLVQDSGIGIPENQLSHIFKPYYQSETRKKNIQGIGAGLSIVKNIMKEVKGDITITSELGKGTTVTMIFLKKNVTEKDKIKKNPYISKPVSRRKIRLLPETFDADKKTILFVEDNIVLIKFLQDYLGKYYNFYYALHGREALQKLEIIPCPDLIISDIMMDTMDGYEFFSKLKESTKSRDIPLVFLSARASVSDKIKGLELGAAVYITKPFEIEVLKAAIDSLIRDHEAIAQKQLETFESRILHALHTQKKDKVLLNRKAAKYNLSQREKEVLYHIQKGHDNHEIADLLCISLDTVRRHVQNLKDKCNVSNKIKLINLFRE